MRMFVMLWMLPMAAMAQDEGMALLKRACTKCHRLEATIRQRNTKDTGRT